jgi:hypothetical protein
MAVGVPVQITMPASTVHHDVLGTNYRQPGIGSAAFEPYADDPVL